jgi:hypothetical protein
MSAARRQAPAEPAEDDAPVTVDLPANAASVLGFGELIDVAELMDMDLDTLRGVLADKSGSGPSSLKRLRVMVAIAYVWHRRTHPDATWAEAQRWRIAGEVGATEPDPTLSGAPAT